jgi:hypothetical protein
MERAEFRTVLIGMLLIPLVLAGFALHTPNRTIGDDVPNPQALVKSFLREYVLSEFVEITPGKGKFPATFLMGSAAGPENCRPAHEVRLSSRFWIAKTEVPQHLYAVVMGKDPSRWKGPRNSAELVTIADANTFCRRSCTQRNSFPPTKKSVCRPKPNGNTAAAPGQIPRIASARVQSARRILGTRPVS